MAEKTIETINTRWDTKKLPNLLVRLWVSVQTAWPSPEAVQALLATRI